MMRLLPALCLLAAATVLLAADEKSANKGKKTAQIQVTSLSIYKAPPPKPGTIMMRNNGLNMEIVISLPSRCITGIDAKASKLDRFTDDKNKALFKKNGGLLGGPNWLNEYGARVDPDGGSVAVQVQGTDAPGKNAGKILLKGSLKVRCGADAKTTEAMDLALKANSEVAVGPFKARVGQFGNVEIWSGEENIQKVEFSDDKGKPIMTAPPARNRNPSKQEKLTYGYSYFLFGKRDKCSLKIYYFTKTETVNVPLDLRVGLGLE